MNDERLATKVPGAYAHRYDDADHADTFSNRMTRCYELALRAQMNLSLRGWRVTLIHGTIGPAKNPHAWLEWRDDHGTRYCWDPIFDGIMPGMTFKRDMYAIEWTRYSPKEAAHWILIDAGNGPWGKRDSERAIACIEAMIAAGHDREAGLTRINEIRQDDRSTKET